MADDTGAAAHTGDPQPRDGTSKPSDVSIDALAERVYRLMLHDLQLERARGARGAGSPRR